MLYIRSAQSSRSLVAIICSNWEIALCLLLYMEFPATCLVYALNTLRYKVPSKLSYIFHTSFIHLGTFLGKEKVPMCLCPTYRHSQVPHNFYYTPFTLLNVTICTLYKTFCTFYITVTSTFVNYYRANCSLVGTHPIGWRTPYRA